MKRPNQDLVGEDTGRTWSGLSSGSNPEAVPITDIASKTQKLVDQGIRVQRVCELCEVRISGENFRYCPHCDAGPLHEACIMSHLCPSVQKGGLQNSRVGNPQTEMEGDDDGYQSYPSWPREEDERQVLRVGIKDPKTDQYAWGKVFSPKRKPIDGPGTLPKCASIEQLQEFSLVGLRQEEEDEIHNAEQEDEKDGRALFEPFVQPKLRNTQPMVKAYARGSLQHVEAAEQDEETFKSA